MATCPPAPTGESPTLAQIQLICSRRKKGSKRQMHLTFLESRPIDSPEELSSIEIRSNSAEKTSISFDDCLAVEYFDVIKNNYQSFIAFYFPALTISIFFADEHLTTKETTIKHLKSMFETSREQSSSTFEEIFHTFDAKLIPFAPLISRDHPLVGPVRLYFTMTDLYIAPFDTSLAELRTAMNNPSALKEKFIFCVPYFTIKHYGNRGRIFLVELGKSKYGDGELRLKCSASTLASTIHLFASPIIEERPWVLSSAFANQFITDKRRAKQQQIHPPIPFHHDVSKGPIIDLSLPFLQKDETPAIEPLPVKSRSFVNTFRKFVKHVSPLQRSATFDAAAPLVSPSPTFSPADPLPSTDRTEPEVTLGSYVDMGPTKLAEVPELPEDEEDRSEKRMIDVGVNTIISISPQVRSAIIVGNSVHLITEEKEVYPIGQRSFTSPASVLQPFRSQLRGQVTVNNYAMPPDLNTCAPISSSSFHQPSSAATSGANLFVAYDILTFNPDTSTKKGDDNVSGSILTSRGSIILVDDQSSTYLFDTPVKQAEPTDPSEAETKGPSKAFGKSFEVNLPNSEDQCAPSPAAAEATESESDPNRIPPFLL